MCIPFQTIPPPTAGTKKAVQMLQILGICEFVVGLLKLFVLQSMSGFYDFFILFILYMAWAQLNYCNCVIVVFYFLQNLLMIFIFFGWNVEMSYNFFSPTKYGVLNFIFYFYYAGACYITFLAYKEFKILQYDQMGGLIQQNTDGGNANEGNANGGNTNGGNTAYQQPIQTQQQPPRQTDFSAFQGRGVQIG